MGTLWGGAEAAAVVVVQGGSAGPRKGCGGGAGAGCRSLACTPFIRAIAVPPTHPSIPPHPTHQTHAPPVHAPPAPAGDALYAFELALSLEKLNFSKLRALHEVGERHGDSQMCDFVGE